MTEAAPTRRAPRDPEELKNQCEFLITTVKTKDPHLLFEELDFLLDIVLAFGFLSHNGVEVVVQSARRSRNDYKRWCEVFNDRQSDPDILEQAPRGMGWAMGAWWVHFGAPLEVPLQRVLAIPDELIRKEKSMLDFVNAFDEQVRTLHLGNNVAQLKGEQLISSFHRDFLTHRRHVLRATPEEMPVHHQHD